MSAINSVIFSLTQQGYSDQIALLEDEIKSLPEDDPSRAYLTGILLTFQIEKSIEAAHPELDPTTKEGAEALQKLFQQSKALRTVERVNSMYLLFEIYAYLLGLTEAPRDGWGFTSVALLGKPGDVTIIHEN